MKPHQPQARSAIRLCLAALIIFLTGLATGDANAAGRRVAFVVGNSDYQNLIDIKKAKTDANLMAEALKRSGFEVFTAIDTRRLAFYEKFYQFVGVLEGADVVLFYYSGHSVQIARQDRIVPVDALVRKAADLEPQTVDLADILQQMQLRSRIQIIIIEACRDDPFPKISYYVGSDNQPVPTTPGCTRKSPAPGVLITQANEPGNPVTGDSPFTETFVARAFLPGEDIHDALRQVRLDIVKQTEGGQVPYFVSALEDSTFYLNDGEASDQATAPDTTGSAAPAEPASKTTPPKKKTVTKKPSAAKPKSINESPPAPQPARATRPNAKIYSYKVWRVGALRSGQRKRAGTPYGALSCTSSYDDWRGVESYRVCKWE